MVDEAVEVPSDSTVAVRWRNLIGQRFLSIEPGSAGTMLGDGDTVAESDDVVDLGRVVNQLSPLAQAVGPDQVNRILTALVTAFEGNEGNYDALLADLGSLTDVLAEREAQLGQMLVDYDTITSAIASRDDQIAAMATNLASITGTLNATDDLIATALTEFAAFADGTETLLARSEEDLGAVLEHVAALTGTVVGDLDVVEQAIQTMPAMLDAVLPTINRGPYLRVNLLCISAGPGRVPPPAALLRGRGRMRLPQIKSFRDRDQVLVGIVGLALIGLLVGGSILAGTSGIFDDRYQLSAVFDRTGGLDSGADVRVAGVAVGTVTSVDADHDLGQVVVAFEVDRGVRLGPDTTAEIAAATLLGGYYLRLDGPVAEPYLEDLAEDDDAPPDPPRSHPEPDLAEPGPRATPPTRSRPSTSTPPTRCSASWPGPPNATSTSCPGSSTTSP